MFWLEGQLIGLRQHICEHYQRWMRNLFENEKFQVIRNSSKHKPHLHHREFMVNKHGQTSSWDYQELCPKCVVIWVICGLELDKHEVECPICRHNEDHLHNWVVDWHKVGKDVHVACCEDQGKQQLALAWYTCLICVQKAESTNTTSSQLNSCFTKFSLKTWGLKAFLS